MRIMFKTTLSIKSFDPLYIKGLLLFACIFFASSMYAQTNTISGVVKDEYNEPLTGVSVHLDGTTQGTLTDIDGKYTIGANKGQVIVFSFVGMKTQKVTVANQTAIDITLAEDAHLLGETVVIGYGTAKAKDLTAPISVVKGEALADIPSSTPMAALQGKVAGVNIINNGAPGEGPTVRIRGVGSFGDSSKPLFVVDGMFYDNINFLSNSDIQEMSVLKDASAAAIYGVRAANGVVLITTKKGSRNQKAQISYDGYVGFQKATNVLKLTNSEQYATMLLEGDYNAYNDYFKQSIDKYGGSYADSDFHNWTFGANNNWYDHLLRTAMITSHGLSINGGSDKASYSLGTNYFFQDGIMEAENNFKRLNFRAAVDYDATSWLKVGFSGVFSNSDKNEPKNSAWQQAFNAPPIFALYDENNTQAEPIKFGSPSAVGYSSNFYNPVATATYNNKKQKGNQALTNFYAQLEFIPSKLNLRTSYSYNSGSAETLDFTPKYYVSSWQQSATTKLNKKQRRTYDYVWDNVLTYNDQIGVHRFGAMVGQSMKEEQWRELEGEATNIPEGSESYWYLNKGSKEGVVVKDDGSRLRSLSFFTRLNYNYNEKYLFMFTMRADGTSRYQEKWGYFPSVGGAWVLSEESFMKEQTWLDFIKLRASWGKLGNGSVLLSSGTVDITTGNDATGVFGNAGLSGFYSNSLRTSLLWEVVTESNVGVNFQTLNNRLDVDIDYYHRLTSRAVISARTPFSTDEVRGNYGKILNSGFDFSINWSDKLSPDFKYNIGINASTLRNRVQSLDGHSIIRGGKTVNIVGQQINSFYGFKMIGVYQTPEEVAADPIAVANGLVPGDLKYADLNGDDVLDGSDRMVLGSYIPNFTYGINIGANYKNFDFQVSTYGELGAQMFNRKRALRYAAANYNFDYAQYKDRWTGPGSTNTNPSAAALLKPWNVSDQKYSSYFVESADFFRIQNVVLGYTFKNLKMGNYVLPGVRLSVAADRPLTLFKANAFSPELSDREGWDTEVYPLSATYTFGVKIDF